MPPPIPQNQVRIQTAVGKGWTPGDGVPQNDSFPSEDNVDSTHPLNLDFVIPGNAQRIASARLSFRLRAYRTYTSAANNPAVSSGSSSAASSGSSSAVSSGASSSASSAGTPHVHTWVVPAGTATGAFGDQAGGGLRATNPTGMVTATETASGVTFSTTTSLDINGAGHTHTIAHTHNIDHTHGIPHTHTVTSNVSLTNGIVEGAVATGVTISIEGTDRTVALGGGTGFTADQVELDVRPYITFTKGVFKTIAFQPSGLGRIHAILRLGYFADGNVA